MVATVIVVVAVLAVALLAVVGLVLVLGHRRGLHASVRVDVEHPDEPPRPGA